MSIARPLLKYGQLKKLTKLLQTANKKPAHLTKYANYQQEIVFTFLVIKVIMDHLHRLRTMSNYRVGQKNGSFLYTS